MVLLVADETVQGLGVCHKFFAFSPMHFALFSFTSDPCLVLVIIMAGGSLSGDIAALTETVKSRNEFVDDTARIQALHAAKGLVEALSSPVEKAIQDVSVVCNSVITEYHSTMLKFPCPAELRRPYGPSHGRSAGHFQNN